MYSYKKTAHGAVLWYPPWLFVQVHSERERGEKAETQFKMIGFI